MTTHPTAAITAMQQAAGEVLPNGLLMASQRELYVQVQRQGWENQKLAAQLATQAAEVARLRAINAGLVEALKPFARVPFDLHQSDDCYVTPAIQIGHLRDARQAIASATADQRGPVLDARGVE